MDRNREDRMLAKRTFYYPLAVFCSIISLPLLTVLMTPICAQAVTTTASPAGGLYNSTQSVTLTADAPSVIFYMTDGSTPTTGSPRYSGPISITSTTTLKFFAVDSNDNAETIKTATYTIDNALPTGSITINKRGGCGRADKGEAYADLL